jgi:SAP domain-containing protein
MTLQIADFAPPVALIDNLDLLLLPQATSNQNQISCNSMAGTLSPTMTLRDFENGYWYLEQLKNFAERIGIPAAKKLRKDELEKAIAVFLRTGKAASPAKRSLSKTGMKDVERGLNLKLRIENYTSNRETKDFIVEQAYLMAPDVREKSGVWYCLNRWREEESTSSKHSTYGDLVRQYITLNKMKRFDRVPHGRYINFVAEFLAADKRATRAEAIAAWTELKELDVPKNYASWVKARAKRKGKSG